MTQQDIRTLLEQPYDRERWKKLVTALFTGRDVFANPVLHEPGTLEDRKHVQRIYQFGEARLKDGELVGLYEAHLQPSVDLARNRASVRKAVEKLVKWGGLSGALISFVDPDKGIWRFSFYSNTLSAEGTWESAHRKRYTYLLGEGEKCRTAAEQFEVLATKAGQVTLKDLLDAFSVEKVSKAFFREYKEHYQDFVQHLTGKRMVKKAGKWEEKVMHAPSPKLAAYFNGNEKDARDFCKKLMGRLVFLYFLQKKRWLGATTAAYADGEPDFVYRLFGAQGNDAFYPNVLVPLFFETLNAERTDDDYRMPDGALRKVPFLNGGLFDMDVLDRRTRLLTFPPELFSNPAKADEEKERGFLDFLNAYNFTVHEAGPEEQTLAVDPEMLGHIFENLLEDNKDKGAFYTPKEIVHYMCQESLVQYLKNYLTRCRPEPAERKVGGLPADLEDKLRRFLQHGEWAELSPYSGVLLKALRNVKVCDPAIGSGAFPMGILHEIFQCVERIHDLSPDETESIWELSEWNPAEVKLRIIQHSIYGVDIERGAVDIARLRFWLSIIVDERAPRTLPNLDYKIVVGDSLLGKFHPGDSAKAEVFQIDWDLKGNTDRVKEMRELIERLGEKEGTFFLDPDEDKVTLKKEITALKVQLLTKQLEMHRDRFKARMLSTGRIGELTAKEKVRAAEEKIQLGTYEEKLGMLRSLAKGKAEHLDYFDWKLDFPEILNANVSSTPGFDIVIGNPPYVRLQTLVATQPEVEGHLKRNYSAAGKGNYDLYVLFVEQGLKLLTQDGHLAFIQPHKFFNAQYGEALRMLISKGRHLSHVVHFGSEQIFQDASTYVCLLFLAQAGAASCLFSKVENVDAWLLTSQAPSWRIAAADITAAEWAFVKSDNKELFDLLASKPMKLEHVTNRIFQGLKTSADKIYIAERLNEGGSKVQIRCEANGKEYSVERRLWHPLVKGGDSRGYVLAPTTRLILFPYEKLDGGTVDFIDEERMKSHYPLTHSYLVEHREALMARESGKMRRSDWYAYVYPKALDIMHLRKLFTPDIAPSACYSIDLSGEAYFTGGVSGGYGLLVKPAYSDYYILGLLNSRVLDWYLKQISTQMRGGWYSYESKFIKHLPIALTGPKSEQRIADLVKKRTETTSGPEATSLEREIDVLVCKLYGLSWEQAKVVDPELGLSQAEYDAVELPDAEGPLGAAGNSVGGAPGVTGLTDEGTLFGQG